MGGDIGGADTLEVKTRGIKVQRLSLAILLLITMLVVEGGLLWGGELKWTTGEMPVIRFEGTSGKLAAEGGALPLHSGPGHREPGPVRGDDREDDGQVCPAVQRLWLLLRRRRLPLASGRD